MVQTPGACPTQHLPRPWTVTCCKCCQHGSAVAHQLDYHVHSAEGKTQSVGTATDDIVAHGDSQEHEKAAIRIRPETGFRGWQQLGSNVTRYDGGFQRDMHEALDFYREEDPARVQVTVRARPLLCCIVFSLRCSSYKCMYTAAASASSGLLPSAWSPSSASDTLGSSVRPSCSRRQEGRRAPSTPPISGRGSGQASMQPCACTWSRC